jgi:co-chaperonin GroES (HSP10)
MKIKSLLNLLLKRLSAGILVPGIGNLGYMECKVVDVGPGRYNPYVDKVIPHGINKGDRVLVNQGVIAKLPLTVDGKKVKWSVVPASECIGPLDENETV